MPDYYRGLMARDRLTPSMGSVGGPGLYDPHATYPTTQSPRGQGQFVPGFGGYRMHPTASDTDDAMINAYQLNTTPNERIDQVPGTAPPGNYDPRIDVAAAQRAEQERQARMATPPPPRQAAPPPRQAAPPQRQAAPPPRRAAPPDELALPARPRPAVAAKQLGVSKGRYQKTQKAVRKLQRQPERPKYRGEYGYGGAPPYSSLDAPNVVHASEQDLRNPVNRQRLYEQKMDSGLYTPEQAADYVAQRSAAQGVGSGPGYGTSPPSGSRGGSVGYGGRRSGTGSPSLNR